MENEVFKFLDVLRICNVNEWLFFLVYRCQKLVEGGYRIRRVCLYLKNDSELEL